MSGKLRKTMTMKNTAEVTNKFKKKNFKILIIKNKKYYSNFKGRNKLFKENLG